MCKLHRQREREGERWMDRLMHENLGEYLRQTFLQCVNELKDMILTTRKAVHEIYYHRIVLHVGKSLEHVLWICMVRSKLRPT